MTAEEEGKGMDPLIGTGLAKAAGSAGEQAGGLLTRVLGPSADQLGAALAQYTEFRLNNVRRIVEKADKKAKGKDAGQVPPRLAHQLLQEGSYSDDELMAEYLSGVLAGGRTPNGRDDRAVSWSSLIASMSTLQLRAHFLLYREWAIRVHGRTDVTFATHDGRNLALMVVEGNEFFTILTEGSDVGPEVALPHAIPGLHRLGLIEDDYYAGGSGMTVAATGPAPYPYSIGVKPTLVGAELYGWAQGVAGLDGNGFVWLGDELDADVLPRLNHVQLPSLPVA